MPGSLDAHYLSWSRWLDDPPTGSTEPTRPLTAVWACVRWGKVLRSPAGCSKKIAVYDQSRPPNAV